MALGRLQRRGGQHPAEAGRDAKADGDRSAEPCWDCPSRRGDSRRAPRSSVCPQILGEPAGQGGAVHAVSGHPGRCCTSAFDRCCRSQGRRCFHGGLVAPGQGGGHQASFAVPLACSSPPNPAAKDATCSLPMPCATSICPGAPCVSSSRIGRLSRIGQTPRYFQDLQSGHSRHRRVEEAVLHLPLPRAKLNLFEPWSLARST